MKLVSRAARLSVDGVTILAAAAIAGTLVVAWSALTGCHLGWPPSCTSHVGVVPLPGGALGAPWDAMTTPATVSQQQALDSLVRATFVLSVALATIAGLSLGIHAASWMLTRWRALGIRSALGAERHHLLVAAAARPAAYCVVGCAVGILGGEGVVSLSRHSWPAILTRPPAGTQSVIPVVAVVLTLAALVAWLIALAALFLLPMRSSTGLGNALRGLIGARIAPLRVQGALAIFQMAAVLLALTPGAILVQGLGGSGRAVSAAPEDSLTLSHLRWVGSTADSAAARSSAYAELLRRAGASGSRPPIITSSGAVLGLGRSIGVIAFCITCSRAGALAPVNGAIVRVVAVAPGALVAMRDTLVSGREFTPHDTFTAPRVAVLSAGAGYSLFPRGDPVGKQVRFPAGPDYAVVGVVRPRYAHGLGSSADDLPLIYVPLLQDPPAVADVIADARQLRDLTRVVAEAGRDLAEPRAVLDPPVSLARFERAFHAPLAWFRAIFLMLFAVSAGLAALATGSLMAHEVQVRQYEIATRAALGAAPWRVAVWMTLRTLGITGLGLLIGATGARACEEWLRSALGQAAASALTTLVAAGVVLALIGLVSSLVPARAAAGIEPAVLWRGQRL